MGLDRRARDQADREAQRGRERDPRMARTKESPRTSRIGTHGQNALQSVSWFAEITTKQIRRGTFRSLRPPWECAIVLVSHAAWPANSCPRIGLPTDGSVKTEQLDLSIGAGRPASAQPVDSPAPATDPTRALRALAERLLEHAGSQIEHWQGRRAPDWLERDLSDCETFIRETSALSGLGLGYEGGQQLAEAKRDRRELRQAREEALRPYRHAAELWRTIRSRLSLTLRKARGPEPGPLLALAVLLEEVGRPLAAADLQTIKEARAHFRQLTAGRAAGRASPGRESKSARAVRDSSPDGTASEAAPGQRPGPGAADPDPELLARYLPPPAELEFEPEDRGLLGRLDERHYDAPEDYRLNQAAQRLSLLSGFEVLLCPPLLRGVDHYAFQLNTARQVMRNMRGRALLCDEVGLGKTIEAGLVLKEYAIRGLARRVLVLTPPSLVSQWRDEMYDKFAIPFATLEDPEFRSHGAEAWERCERVIASIHTAKSPKHAERIQRVPYDLIIVDEAHHLRNRASRSWKFVNQLKSKYLLLLTATPAQNDLDELFNLITLLSPGQLKSPADFRREFVERHDPRRPRNRTKLRELLMDVMVRNSRSQVSLRLPPREAATLPIALTPAERALYDGVTRLVRAGYGRPADAHGGRVALQALQAEAGSSASAVRATLATMIRKSPAADWRAELGALLELAARVEISSKAMALVDLMRTRLQPGEKILVFTQYLETQAFLADLLGQAGIPAALFNGSLSAGEKDAAIAVFARDRRVLISTDVGSEGRNLQFCHTIVNYDLPWNPMRIEQRVGRVHRIGQTEPVRIFNLAAAGTLEGHILEVLDSKINMFELVVGEIGEILGNLEEEREFEDIVLDLWAGAESDEAAEARFAQLGERLVSARQRYLENKAYDEALFGQDFAAEE